MESRKEPQLGMTISSIGVDAPSTCVLSEWFGILRLLIKLLLCICIISSAGLLQQVADTMLELGVMVKLGDDRANVAHQQYHKNTMTM
eukprot:3796726-Amphidinium_carterae.1